MDSELSIVGIDPGTTAAVAVLDLEGDLRDYTSRKNFSKDRMIQFIVENGNPLIVAADVSPAPSRVEEIASNMGSVLYSPEEDLESGYKEELSSEFHVREDSHVRDALAAAEYARRKHRNDLEGVRRRVREEEIGESFSDVVELVFKGSLPLSQAVREVEKAGEEADEEEETVEKERDWKEISEKRKERIEFLEDKVENLEEHLDSRESREEGQEVSLSELKSRNRIIRDLRAEMDRKESRLEEMESRIDSLEEALRRMAEGWVRVPKRENLEDADSPSVHLESYDGENASEKVQQVLIPGGSRELEREGIKVIDTDELGEGEYLDVGDAYIVRPETLEEKTDSEGFMRWLESYRTR
ncbi:MAG: DUF460 domain-containing protein [Candidatus Nanohaloarchaea archaeon]|nr:DUF460 domain-containing protein [Candidatus Nanohaloarchaea archaeon]